MKNFVTTLLKKIVNEEIESRIKEIKKEYNTPIPLNSDDLNEVYLFDFKMGYRSGNYTVPSLQTESTGDESKEDEIKKIRVKPVDILNQLERKPNIIDLELLDEKIVILNEKTKIIHQEYARREVEAMIERLNNRKKYIEYKKYFDQFDYTDDTKINSFLNKYDLVMEKADIFIPDFPEEAVKTMTEYENVVMEISGKKPVYYVIAEKSNFKQADNKRDPILLVQSPFGFYWQILGAWDKELMYLSDL